MERVIELASTGQMKLLAWLQTSRVRLTPRQLAEHAGLADIRNVRRNLRKLRERGLVEADQSGRYAATDLGRSFDYFTVDQQAVARMAKARWEDDEPSEPVKRRAEPTRQALTKRRFDDMMDALEARIGARLARFDNTLAKLGELLKELSEPANSIVPDRLRMVRIETKLRMLDRRLDELAKRGTAGTSEPTYDA